MRGQGSIILGISFVIVGAGMLVVVWDSCLKEAIDFLERYISPILKPIGEVFGLDQGDLFRSADGTCRKWWADSAWVVAVVLLVAGVGFFLSGFYKLLRGRTKHSARQSRMFLKDS